jgi:DNA polymerase-3 subunit alpha
MAEPFVHCHVHTEYSLLDGASRIGELVQAAVADGQPALAMTDHGNLYGALEHHKACRAAGIKPILGMEAYMAAESRHDRPRRSSARMDDTGGEAGGGEKLYYHLILLATSTVGWRNLVKLSSAAFLEGYYYKPRIDWELLDTYHEGLVATTGCLGGLVAQALLAGDEPGALAIAGRLQDVFGRDSLYVEIQDHGLAAQRQTNPALVRIAKALGAPLLVTNDSHYTRRADAEVHDALLCVQTGATISDPNRFRFEGSEHYLKTGDEMRALFPDLPEAARSSLEIAERVEPEIVFASGGLPRFPVPDHVGGATEDDRQRAYLRELTFAGARERYGDPLPGEVRERIDFELATIEAMGFSPYFLVVWDLVRYAKSAGIRVGPGRGSAAGCCVAYCLGIVELDPIRYGLLFERFLNPGRKQMPDIDMDFDERYRGDMIRYAAERYGADHVAQIVTFSTIKARAAVRDAARVLGYPYATGDRIAKAMPPLVMGRDTPLWACLEKVEGYEDGFVAAQELREIIAADPDAARVVEVAKGLEGLRRQDGIHAAAVVITDQPLVEYLPIQRKPVASASAADGESAPIVTQFEMHGVEELGLLKMDFLGLRNLSVIEQTLDFVERTRGTRPDIDAAPLDDEATFELLRRAETVGVFQLEGGPMRSLIRALRPTSFDDVAALVALYRPGPMAANMHLDYAERKNDPSKVSYLHPDLEPILAETYGLMIYQESVMRVAQRFAGYSLAEADNLRKACGKKIRSLIAAEREKFVAGCEAQGYGTELGTKLFDIIEPFADYAFNKSHSYGYGLVAYQTAYLKAHWPVEYLSALLTSVADDKDKTALYLAEARNLGITVAVPDVNASGVGFTPLPSDEGNGAKGGRIRFGLAAIRNVGESVAQAIIAEREANGPYQSFTDFCWRVEPMVLNRRTIESLAKAGAFDSFGVARAAIAEAAGSHVADVLARRREAEAGIQSLFDVLGGEGGPAPDGSRNATSTRADDGPWTRVPEWGKDAKLASEKEMLGLYVSDHPLSGVERALRLQTDCTIAELLDRARSEAEPGRGALVRVGGIVTGTQRRFTKRGELMATFVLEDFESAVEVFVFPKAMADYGGLVADDARVVVAGRVMERDDALRLVCSELTPLELRNGEDDGVLGIRLDGRHLGPQLVDAVAALLEANPGSTPVFLYADGRTYRLPPAFAVDARPGLLGELRELLGAEALVLGAAPGSGEGRTASTWQHASAAIS